MRKIPEGTIILVELLCGLGFGKYPVRVIGRQGPEHEDTPRTDYVVQFLKPEKDFEYSAQIVSRSNIVQVLISFGDDSSFF